MPGVPDQPSYNIHNADGVTTIFPHTLFGYLPANFKVYTVNGSDEPIDVTSSVTVTLNSSFIGGNVTFPVAPSAPLKVLIQRDVPYSQDVQFDDLTRYKETAIETALNILCLQNQQLRDQLLNAIKFLPTAAVTDARVGAPVDGAALIFSGLTGLIVAGPDAEDIANAAPSAATAVAAAATATAAAATATAAVGTVKITTNDTTGSVLDTALLVSSSFAKTVNNPGANETLTISLAANGVAYANINSGDIASTANIIAGTASKIVTAANLVPLLHATQVSKAAAQSIPNATDTVLTFDNEVFDDGGWHDNAVNPTRITPGIVGRYRVTGVVDFGSPGAGSQFRVYIYVNGAMVEQEAWVSTVAAITAFSICRVITLASASDYIELYVYQAIGGALNTVPARTKLTVERLK